MYYLARINKILIPLDYSHNKLFLRLLFDHFLKSHNRKVTNTKKNNFEFKKARAGAGEIDTQWFRKFLQVPEFPALTSESSHNL